MKTRVHGAHLTDAELEVIRDGFRHGITIADLAAEVGCSSRTVIRHFGRFREEGLVRGSRPVPAAAVARPSRFCKSTFEL